MLDELSEGLQSNIVAQIGETLRDINEELGTTIFFAEQNLEFTVNTSDFYYIMEKGTVVNDLAPEELEDSEVVQKYIASDGSDFSRTGLNIKVKVLYWSDSNCVV